ncbi:MAG: hypothetical protein ABR543_16585 [Gemmatimonadaceae bacterium]
MERKTVAMLRLSVLIALLGGISASTSAQTPGTMYGDLQSALEKAQAGAHRPGDESLSCEALESELVAAAKDPALQSYVAKMGAVAQEKLGALNAASKVMAAQSAVTVFSSIVPGGAWAGQAAAAAQLPAQQAQAARNIQEAMQQAQEMMPVMPQLMRGQRVIELAQARDCAWLREGLAR